MLSKQVPNCHFYSRKSHWEENILMSNCSLNYSRSTVSTQKVTIQNIIKAKCLLNHSHSVISTQAKPVSWPDKCYDWNNISFDWIANERCLTSPFSYIPICDIRIIAMSFQHKKVRIKKLKSKCLLNHSRSAISTQAKPVSGTDECYNWQNISFDWIANERCLTSPFSYIPI